MPRRRRARNPGGVYSPWCVEGMRRHLIILGVCATGALGACGGPLDSPDPPTPRRDAGVDLRTGMGGYRVVGGLGGANGGLGGGGFQPDAGAAWPVVMGCVSGAPPTPRLVPTVLGLQTIGCTGVAQTVARLIDDAGQGLVYYMGTDLPLLSVPPMGIMCGNPGSAPIGVTVAPGIGPGSILNASVSVAIQGPFTNRLLVPLSLQVQSTDFTLDTDVVDFGSVFLGAYVYSYVSVTNGPASAPLSALFGSPMTSGPFSLMSTRDLRSDLPPLAPGDSGSFFLATLTAQTAGTFQAVFGVSPFAPGAPIDPLCGMPRRLVLRAQVIATAPSP